MHIITRKPFIEACIEYPNDKVAIMDAYRVLKSNRFENPEELRQLFPSLDNFKYKDKWWVIDIGGNNLRMLAFIQFVNNRFYIKHIVSHAEYDKLCQKYR